ncbi:U-box domain-containing protein [Musa troglodytarum]|nr:U-box domain-containing protein [Musa troglodytarum]
MLMFTLGILDALVVALCLLSLAHHIIVTLYSLLSVKAYCSINESKKPLIITLDVSIRSIKDVVKVFFSLFLYPLNRIALIELSIMSPLFALVVTNGRRGGCKGLQ